MIEDIRSSLQIWERIFFRGLTGVLCVLILTGVWLSRFGLPDWMADGLMRRIDTGSFALEAERIRMGPLKGVRLEGVAAYRRGVVGPPAVEASEVLLRVDPLAVLRGVGTVHRIEIRDGELRPTMAFGRGHPGGDRSVGMLRADLIVTQCRVQGVMVEALQTRLRLNGTSAYLEDARMTVSRDGMRGTASGSVQYNRMTDTLKGSASLVMDPRITLPVLKAWKLHGLARVFDRFEFGAALPECMLDFEADCEAGGHIVIDGNAHLRSARYRGVDAMQADAVLHVEREGTNLVVALNPLSVVRRDGNARGLVVIDLRRGTVRFDAHSSLNPHLLRQVLGILQDPFWERWTFDGSVNIDVRGIAGYASPADTDVLATFDANRMRYKEHQFEQCAFSMRMTGRTNVLSSVQARLYGGDVIGVARFVAPEAPASNMAFEVAVKVKDVDFERVTDELIDDGENAYRGHLSGELALHGVLGEQNVGTLTGNGLINIDDGHVFMLPLFGGLSDIMTRIIPGLDFVLRQSDAFVEFHVADSRVVSQKAKIEGSILSLTGTGYCGFDKGIDFHVQAKLMKDSNMLAKLIRILTVPISKLFEFRVRGSLDDAHWYPVNFSGDLLEKVGLRGSDQ